VTDADGAIAAHTTHRPRETALYGE
jgi:hypothetical protein